MRAKELWEVIPFQEQIHALSSRVTSNKWTKAYSLLAALHCVLQIGLQFGAYANNHATASSFEVIVSNTTLTPEPFAILEQNGDMTLCTNIPQRFGGPDPCTRVSFRGGSPGRIAIFSPRFIASHESETADEIELEGLEKGEEVNVGPECLQTFPWVFDVIHNATREDLVFVLFQGWLLGVSLAAILKESIPHLATTLASETLATVWSVYKVVRTESFKVDFVRIVTSTCGVNVLPHYFGFREGLEATIMVLNMLALLSFAFLSWRLYKDYAPRMLKHVDSRPDMEHLYRVTLSLSTVIHLAAFFLLIVSFLFIDQLFLGRIRWVADHVTIYEVLFMLIVALVAPWVVVGRISSRRESRMGMILFFIISLAFLAVWGAMFSSQVYQFMFFTWSFFATVSIFACLLLVTLVCLSVYVFLGFGLGLTEYLERPLSPHPADKVSWIVETGIDPEPAKLREDVRTDALSRGLALLVSTDQVPRISIQSIGSVYSLDTPPSRHVVEQESRSNSPRPRLGQPITARVTLSSLANSSSGSLPDAPRLHSGLTVPPRKPPPRSPALARLLVPPSRWSVTTASSESSTPAPISATGFNFPNQSRWSSSTAKTNTTFTSRLSELPLIPALPSDRVPASGELNAPFGSGHRKVI